MIWNFRHWCWVFIGLSLGMVPSCAWLANWGPPSQAQLKALETRTLDAPFDAVYAAATEALFDLGYQVAHSDKTSGVVVGQKTKTESEWIKGPSGYFSREKRTMLSLTLLIKPMGAKTTDVRIKTAVDGASRLDKGAINEVWLYIDRQILMEAPSPVPVKTPVKRR